MQISSGMRISDVCSFCYEHTIDQPCPMYDAWIETQEPANIWGTDESLIGEGFCLKCEREEPRHYNTCPLNDDNPYEEI